MEDIAHGDLAAEFYQQGFRRVVSDSNISRPIVVPPVSLRAQEKDSGKQLAQSIE